MNVEGRALNLKLQDDAIAAIVESVGEIVRDCRRDGVPTPAPVIASGLTAAIIRHPTFAGLVSIDPETVRSAVLAEILPHVECAIAMASMAVS